MSKKDAIYNENIEKTEFLLNKVIDNFRKCGVDVDDIAPYTIEISKRFKRTYGRCKSFFNLYGHSNSILQFADFLYGENNEEQLEEVIAHEFVHHLYPKDGHTGMFKVVAEQVKDYYTITRFVDSESATVVMNNAKSSFKYVLVDKNTGNVVKGWKTRCKTVDRYFKANDLGNYEIQEV
jgi:predicted SprT family Zn-dependent metalloprotease